MDEKIRDKIVELCRAIVDNPEDNDLIEGYLQELMDLNNYLWP